MPELGTWLIRGSRCVGTFWDHAADAGTQLNILTLKFREGLQSAGESRLREFEISSEISRGQDC